VAINRFNFAYQCADSTKPQKRNASSCSWAVFIKFRVQFLPERGWSNALLLPECLHFWHCRFWWWIFGDRIHPFNPLFLQYIIWYQVSSRQNYISKRNCSCASLLSQYNQMCLASTTVTPASRANWPCISSSTKFESTGAGSASPQTNNHQMVSPPPHPLPIIPNQIHPELCSRCGHYSSR